MNKLAIIGASGHGKVVADAAERTGQWEQVIFFDDAWPELRAVADYPVIGSLESFKQLKEIDIYFIVAIGHNETRLRIHQDLTKLNYRPATIVHPSAVVANSANIGAGSVVFANAVVNAYAEVGDAVIVNSNATVEHDCQLADGVHISPGANVAGGVTVGTLSWIGIGASIIQVLKIGSNVTVGAGAVVVCNVNDNNTVVGIPARVIK